MKRNILVLGLALLTIAFASCSKEESRLCQDPFVAHTEGSNAKTHLVDDNNLNVKWDLDLVNQPEEIYVYAQVSTTTTGEPYYNVARYEADEVTEGGTKAHFNVVTEGDCVDGAVYKAFYPANDCDIQESQVQTGTERVRGSWHWNVTRYRYSQHQHKYVEDDSGDFILVDGQYVNKSGFEGNEAYGYYDYTDEPTYGTSEIITSMTLPSTQYFHDLSMRQSPMYAEGTSRDLDFYNLCGGLDLYLEEAGITVSRIEIITHDQQITGTFEIQEAAVSHNVTNDPLNRNRPYFKTSTIEDINDQTQNWNKLELDCDYQGCPGVDITNGEHFYITLPVGNYNSFEIAVYTNDGECAVRKMTLDQGHTFAIERSKFSTITFHDMPFTPIPGIVPGIFSVNDTHQVYFAHGNLWWAPYTGSPWANEPHGNQGDQWFIAYEQFDNFSFGENAWGYPNPYNYYGPIDTMTTTSGKHQNVPQQLDYYELFCFSTGTQDRFGAIIPHMTWSGRNNDRRPSFDDDRLTGGNYVEWGTLPIKNGTSVEGQWRTLTGGTNGEWQYLMQRRSVTNHNAQAIGSCTEGARYALVRVGGVPGLLLFPDHFTWPEGVTVPTYINTLLKEDNTNVNWMGNDVPNYSMVRAQEGDDQYIVGVNCTELPASMTCDFRKLEKAGFVFLPCVGLREGDDIRYCGGMPGERDNGWGQDLRYYSASPSGSTQAFYLGVKLSGSDRMQLIAGDVADNAEGLVSNDRGYGRAVRLVMDVR